MKRVWCFLVCGFLLSGCSVPSIQEEPQSIVLEAQLIELQEDVNQLKESLDESQREIASLKMENKRIQDRLTQNELGMELFPRLSNLSLNFVRAHTRGDAVSLRSLVGEPIRIQKENGILIGSWEENGQEIEWELWKEDDSKTYQDMVIQGFGWLEEGRYVIHIREFYTESGEETSPPTFLNLHFQEEDSHWKIVYFEFDV